MKFSDISLPSNRSFGLFFTVIFLLFSGYFFFNNSFQLSQVFVCISVIFFILSILNPKILLPLNFSWMFFGFLMGLVVSPIVLGAIFFLIFTPIGLFMKIIGRDELRVKKLSLQSYWKKREINKSGSNHFKNQF